MPEVTLSEHYQIAIPKEISGSLHLKVGQNFLIVIHSDSISLTPKTSISEFRGILKGADTDNIRDRTERI